MWYVELGFEGDKEADKDVKLESCTLKTHGGKVHGEKQ